MKSYRNMTKSELLEVLEKHTSERVRNPEEVYAAIISALPNNDTEHFVVLTLDGSHKLRHAHVVTSGLINRTIVHPREVFRPALLDNAAAIIIAHNHPSGTTDPSPEDNNITQRLKNAGEILGISILDHIIVTEISYYSYLEAGAL